MSRSARKMLKLSGTYLYLFIVHFCNGIDTIPREKCPKHYGGIGVLTNGEFKKTCGGILLTDKLFVTNGGCIKDRQISELRIEDVNSRIYNVDKVILESNDVAVILSQSESMDWDIKANVPKQILLHPVDKDCSVPYIHLKINSTTDIVSKCTTDRLKLLKKHFCQDILKKNNIDPSRNLLCLFLLKGEKTFENTYVGDPVFCENDILFGIIHLKLENERMFVINQIDPHIDFINNAVKTTHKYKTKILPPENYIESRFNNVNAKNENNNFNKLSFEGNFFNDYMDAKPLNRSKRIRRSAPRKMPIKRAAAPKSKTAQLITNNTTIVPRNLKANDDYSDDEDVDSVTRVAPKKKIIPKTRIVGGYKCDHSKYPFLVKIGLKSRTTVFCGGSLLTSRFVLTAAHCNGSDSDSDVYEITTYRNKKYEIEHFFIHNNYDEDTLKNDIAVAKLKYKVRHFRRNMFVTLPRRGTFKEPIEKLCDKVLVMGYGVSYFFDETDEYNDEDLEDLMCVNIPTISLSKCRTMYEEAWVDISDANICTLSDNGGDACSGDSGGPLMCKGYQMGIVSWGDLCGDDENPGIFIRVDAHLDFIRRVVRGRFVENVGPRPPNVVFYDPDMDEGSGD